MRRRFRLGLIVNPIAGMGGRVGFKGTDGLAQEARAMGAKPVAGEKALRALARLAAARSDILLAAGHGVMGQEASAGSGFLTQLAGTPAARETSAEDTRRTAQDLRAMGVDLILFAGGDGTARDIFEVVGERIPLLGIPAGVKMQSGVFATSPEAAGEIVATLAAMDDRSKIAYRASEIMDMDETALRQGVIAPQLYGYAKVPDIPLRLQNAKARQRALDEATVEEAAKTIAAEMEPEAVYAIGPGRTTMKVLQALGIEGTLLGTDLVRHGELVSRDANEAEILRQSASRTLKIIVGVIGGQGYVFGRGNQELSPEVIRRAGRGNIIILAAQRKLVELPDKRLLVDTGDAALDAELAGYWRIVVGPVDQMVMKMVAA